MRRQRKRRHLSTSRPTHTYTHSRRVRTSSWYKRTRWMSHRRSQVTRSSTNRSRGGRRQRMRSRSSGTKRTTTTTPHYEPHTHTCTHTNTRTQTHPDHQPFPDTAPPDCRPCSRSSVGAQPLTRRPQCLKRINQPESPAAATSAAVLTVSGLGCCRRLRRRS
jgi:hypothetical protein